MKMRAFDYACGQPWAITDEALNTIAAIALGMNDPQQFEGLQMKQGQQLRGASRALNVRDDNVAVIPVTGPIFRYANLFTMMSGATSTELLATDIYAALEDDSIRGIVLDFNSPGGLVAGINELADAIYAGRKRKRIVAYGGGQVASAAYWLAAAADEVVVERTAVVGSIGVILSLTDTKQRDEKSGVRTYQIVSSASPDKILDPNDEPARAKLQKIVDDQAAVFVESIARSRDVTVATVLRDYGAGGVLIGDAAVDAGLADRIGSLESVIAELSASGRANRRTFIMKTALGPITVSTTAQLRAAMTAGHTPEEISIGALDTDKIKADAKAEGVAEAQTAAATELAAAVKTATEAGTAEGVKSERARITGLNAIAMKGFDKEISEAIAKGATVEATAIQISQLARTRGTTVDAQRRDAPGAIGHGGQPGTESDRAVPGATADDKHGWGAAVAKVKTTFGASGRRQK